jgi:predicted nucleic acid-binding protein
MAPRVLIDTSGWYALIDRTDSAHERAATVVGKLVRGGSRLVTSDYILDESYTLASARLGSVGAARLMDLVERTSAVDTEWIGGERFAAARSMFRKQLDQGLSFTDCTSFVVMRELHMVDAITTDRHFRSAGFHPLLPTAPAGSKVREGDEEYGRGTRRGSSAGKKR